MTGPLAPPGRSGVRVAGDHYQWLHAWHACMTMLRDSLVRSANPVVQVGVEVDGVGNLDDIVQRRSRPPHTFTQVKYAVDGSTPANTEWLTDQPRSGGRPLLRKLSESWKGLADAGEPVDLRLTTNRAPDPGDALLAGRDARTNLLMPAAAAGGAQSARGKLRAVWEATTGLSPEELLRFLRVLHLDVARDLAYVEEAVSSLMIACGLRGDAEAVRAGADWIAAKVRHGVRNLQLDDVQAAAEDLGLRRGEAWSVLSVATLKPDPVADLAAAALDWTDRFEGTDAWSKRRPLAPATWQQLHDDIQTVAASIAGNPRVLVTGSLRQATGFAVGAALRMVTGTDVAVVQRGETWSSMTAPITRTVPGLHRVACEHGADTAIAVSVATDISDDVLAFITSTRLPVGQLVCLSPPAGAHDRSVVDAASAGALALGIRDAVRKSAGSSPRVHLFLAGPLGLALLLGNRWNRIAPTIVYEDLGPRTGYEAAFTVPA